MRARDLFYAMWIRFFFTPPKQGGQYHNFTIAPVTQGKNGILSYEFGLDFSGTQTSGLTQDRFEFYVFPKVNLHNGFNLKTMLRPRPNQLRRPLNILVVHCSVHLSFCEKDRRSNGEAQVYTMKDLWANTL